MHPTALPNPGRVSNSLLLRREVVKTISYIETSRRPNGEHPAAAEVIAFLNAAATYLGSFVVAPDPDPEEE